MKFNLYKIAFLTTILEFLALCIVLVKNLTLANRIWFVPIIITFMDMIDMLTNVYIVHLMIDHNNDSYVTFIRRLSKIGLFCICPSFIETTSIMEVEENLDRDKEEQNKEGTIMDTKSMYELPAPIPIELHASAPSIDEDESTRL